MGTREVMNISSDSNNARELLTVDDAADYLKVSRMTVWRWCNNGQLPAFKIGREWRIHRGALEALMQERMRRSENASEK